MIDPKITPPSNSKIRNPVLLDTHLLLWSLLQPEELNKNSNEHIKLLKKIINYLSLPFLSGKLLCLN